MEYSQANGIFRAGAEYSVRVRNIPCGCRIFRAGAKYSVRPLAYSVLPLAVSIRLSKWPLADSKPVGEREPTRKIFKIDKRTGLKKYFKSNTYINWQKKPKKYPHLDIF